MKNYHWLDAAVLALIFLFLLSFFQPQYLFSLTTTSGGDTGSHYPTAVYLKEVLLPQGKILGWEQGNYAGFPLFYHYFPLTFLIMAFLNFVIPMQIAFKLVTVLGTFLLPLCVYQALRLLRYQFPIPAVGAVFSLAFLFMQANSMWGGNIPSTLAGEYSYSLGLALVILFFGSLYHSVPNRSGIILNALLFCAIGLSHGYTMILAGVAASFFLFTRRDFRANFLYLFKVFGLGGLLFSFWFVPFVFNISYVTSYVARWHVGSLGEVIPVILVPFFVLGAASLFLNLFDRRTWYFAYVIGFCLALYYLGPSLGMLDIRFIPFVQLFVVIFSATFILNFLDGLQSRQLLPFIVLLMGLLWVSVNTTFIKSWIKWNYEGVEQKASWPLFKSINDYFREHGQGRVVYEHSPAHNTFGTERAFENLPYFAKRYTLEGLYMQSSISAPFIFYIQSEVSKVCSGPFPQYKYSGLNLAAAIPHLKLFNVGQYLARSPEAKQQAKVVPGLKLEKQFGDYEIHRVLGSGDHYVVPLANQPVLFKTANWKSDFHDWFRRQDLLDIPLVYLKEPNAQDLSRFKLRSEGLLNLPRQPIKTQSAQITEKIGPEQIEFTTNLVGSPHLIKVSYHPNWQVVGADKIYLVSPSFMLVYPNQPHVKLRFGQTIYNYVGKGLSLLGLVIIGFTLFRKCSVLRSISGNLRTCLPAGSPKAGRQVNFAVSKIREIRKWRELICHIFLGR